MVARVAFPLKDTAGELSPSAPSPRSGEGWGKNAPGEHYKGRRLWIRQQYLKGCRPSIINERGYLTALASSDGCPGAFPPSGREQVFPRG